jgi:hypothetical protein
MNAGGTVGFPIELKEHGAAGITSI